MIEIPQLKWVDSKWVYDNLDGNVTVIDCQPNVHDFIRCHIPGAIYLNEESLRLSQGSRPHVWLDSDLASKVLSAIGVRLDKPVVVYGRSAPGLPLGDGVPPLMVSYSLIRYGHNRVFVLDGGLDEWLRTGYECQTRYVPISNSRFVAKVRRELFIEYEDFINIKDKSQTLHIDSRSTDQYAGFSPWPKKGHIPGAVNLPWSESFEVGNLCKLRDPLYIKKRLRALRASKDREIICHCGSGRKAASQFCVLKWFLGYPKVRLYEGSFTEWCSHEENPTVIGHNPS